MDIEHTIDLGHSIEEARRNGVEFLIADLGLAAAMLKTARITQDPETALRNRANARKAYDTVSHLLSKSRSTAAEHEEVTRKLAELRLELESIGERF